MSTGFLSLLNKFIYQLSHIPGLRSFAWAEKFIKFCLVGIANTVIDFTIFFSLTRLTVLGGAHYLWVNFLAFVTANIFSFVVNKNWTFGNKGKDYFKQYYRFFSVSLLALVTVQITLYSLVTVLGVWDVAAKIVALVVSVIIGFLGSRWWVFR